MQLDEDAQSTDDDMYLGRRESDDEVPQGPQHQHNGESEDEVSTDCDDLVYAQKHGISNLLKVRTTSFIMNLVTVF